MHVYIPGLVGLDLGVGGGLDGDGEEVIHTISPHTHAPPMH